MQPSDLPKVYALESQCQLYPWPPWIFRRQLRTRASCWVLELDDEIIGFGIVVIVKHMAHIMNMCVAPGYRRLGLGRCIMLQLLNVAKHQHARYAWLEVRRSNQAAILLYRKLGFRQKKIRKHYYLLRRGREDGITMVAQLGKIKLHT